MRGVIAFIVICAATAFAASQPASGPRIDLNETEYRFGRVPDDRTVEHVFRVKNTGKKPLIISRVSSSCGCTAAMMESSVIDPGETGKLRVSFNPGRLKGTITRSVSLHSNDTYNPVVTIKVIAEVAPAGEGELSKEPPERAHDREEKLLFESRCMGCHGPRRKGEAGIELYMSVCAACHGRDGRGRKIGEEVLGPTLDSARRSVKSKGGVTQLICAGTGHPYMPGFGESYKGPLSEEQIASLVEIVIQGIPKE
jgi:cytochrome c553